MGGHRLALPARAAMSLRPSGRSSASLVAETETSAVSLCGGQAVRLWPPDAVDGRCGTERRPSTLS